MSSQPSGSIKLANSKQEIAACYPVMLQLRLHLDSDKFTTQVKSQMAEGYQLAYFQENQIIHGAIFLRVSPGENTSMWQI